MTGHAGVARSDHPQRSVISAPEVVVAATLGYLRDTDGPGRAARLVSWEGTR